MQPVGEPTFFTGLPRSNVSSCCCAFWVYPIGWLCPVNETHDLENDKKGASEWADPFSINGKLLIINVLDSLLDLFSIWNHGYLDGQESILSICILALIEFKNIGLSLQRLHRYWKNDLANVQGAGYILCPETETPSLTNSESTDNKTSVLTKDYGF